MEITTYRRSERSLISLTGFVAVMENNESPRNAIISASCKSEISLLLRMISHRHYCDLLHRPQIKYDE